MKSTTTLITTLCFWAVVSVSATTTTPHNGSSNSNITFENPVIPGFHPDPSCIFLSDSKWDDIFLCASSSFNAFPGIPLHASKDAKNWKLIGHALNRREQLPRLAETNRSTSGIWAPTLRQHNGEFWVVTTLVDDHKEADDASRWDNASRPSAYKIIFKASDPFNSSSWSNAVHFPFEGYDTSPLWDEEDGQAYIVGAHAFKVYPGIQLAKVNLDTGEVGKWVTIWNGTGGAAPEGPHIYQKDGYYYVLIAEGGTGVGHMVTIARSNNLYGPYESNPSNPILTNANTTNYFQTVGHADLVEDKSGNWWCFALSTRSGPEHVNYPMGRETILTPTTWEDGEWPFMDPVYGKMRGWPTPSSSDADIEGGSGPYIGRSDDKIDFAPGSSLPGHFTYWRFPIEENYQVSPPGHPNNLALIPSKLNLTAYNGNYAGPSGQTFVSRRQEHTLFTYSATLDFSPEIIEEEAGVTVFLTQNHHLDLGLVMLPVGPSNSTTSSELALHLRFRGISEDPVPGPLVKPVPESWKGKPLKLEIKAANETHYWFSAGLAQEGAETETLVAASNDLVSWGFTGVLLGVYATSNGGEGNTAAYFSDWKYEAQGQITE